MPDTSQTTTAALAHDLAVQSLLNGVLIRFRVEHGLDRVKKTNQPRQ